MKAILIVLSILYSFQSFAINRAQVEQLLKQKNISLNQLESKGSRVLLGEITGHGKNVPFAQVQIILTDSAAILKNEIDGVSFNGREVLGGIQSVRFNGQYILKEDVKATIVMGL